MDFFERWFKCFGDGLEKLDCDERGRLFSVCAAACAKDALKHLYCDLFNRCDGNLDLFFSRLHEVKNVDGTVIERGRVYELMFLECGCDLHTRANVSTPKLCECSRQSIIAEFRKLLPGQDFVVEERETILGGSSRCCFRINRVEEGVK